MLQLSLETLTWIQRTKASKSSISSTEAKKIYFSPKFATGFGPLKLLRFPPKLAHRRISVPSSFPPNFSVSYPLGHSNEGLKVTRFGVPFQCDLEGLKKFQLQIRIRLEKLRDLDPLLVKNEQELRKLYSWRSTVRAPVGFSQKGADLEILL